MSLIKIQLTREQSYAFYLRKGKFEAILEVVSVTNGFVNDSSMILQWLESPLRILNDSSIDGQSTSFRLEDPVKLRWNSNEDQGFQNKIC